MLTMEEVQSRLEPFIECFVSSHEKAVASYRKALEAEPEMVAAFSPSRRALDIHERTCFHIRSASLRMEGIHVTSLSTFFVAVGNEVLVRFKTLQSGSPRNHASEAQWFYDRQQIKPEDMEDLASFGILEPPTIVTCGYTLHLSELLLDRVLIQRDCKGHQPWWYTISGGVEISEPLHIAGTEEITPARIAPKRKSRPVEGSGSL
ncbi:MAG: hypothetical protein PXZ08_11540 [Actinomycetota bacterium]|nr:hypothetical protein [Actinomycetota bacterium]